MPLITTSVPNLVQGVSQQPDNLRHPGQAESQTNALSSVVDGLTKRPNTDHVKVVGTNALASKTHIFNRDGNNQHAFLFTHNTTNGLLVAKNLANGNDVPVTISTDAQAYLDTATAPTSHLSVLSVADYTFVASNQQTVAMDSATSTALANEAIVFIKQGDKDAVYTVTIDGTAVSDTYSSSHSSANIASNLASQITSAGISGVSSVTANGSVIKIVMSSALNVTVSDTLSNTALGLVYKEVNYITDLPAKCFNGHRVKIRGDLELSQDDYYVKFVTKDSATFGEGAWEEDVGYGVKTTLDKTTMPIEIVPTFESYVSHGGNVYKALSDHTSAGGNEPGTGGGAAYWELDTSIKVAEAWSASSVAYVGPSTTIVSYAVQTATWTNRLCGDADTNPDPSFVGKAINDMFFYKNRLGVLTDTSVVFSEADQYFNFFRTTVLTLLDSAPIDVGVAHTKITTLKNAVAFQEKLVLFSEQSQFILQGNELLTPKTVNIAPVTEYEKKEEGTPVTVGNFIYFTYPRGSYTGVYEYAVDSSSEVYSASDLTAQAPAYIPSQVYDFVGSANENTLIGRSASTNDVYVYRYFWQGNDKIQSSWSKFTFANSIVGMGVIESTLYLFTHDGTNQCLETLDLSPKQTDTGKSYKILLDRRVASSALGKSYSATSKLTTVTSMPYDPVNSVVYTADGGRYALTRTSATEFTVNGDITPYVSHGGSFYRCLQDHTSSSSTEPGTGGGSAYWTVDGTVSSAQAWSSSSVSYRVNDFFVGLEYDMEYEFSTQTLKQPTERGGRASSNFTNQILRNGAVEYSDTGHFTIEVTPQYRDTYSYAFNPSMLGADSVVGSLVLDDGSFRFPVHCKHDEATIKIKSSSALPMKVLSAEFENFIHARSRRYS